MFRDYFPIETSGEIFNKNSAKLNIIKDNYFDVIISSPPYYDTLDYVSENKLRLEFLKNDTNKQNKLKKKLTQNKDTYLSEMFDIGKEMKRVLKQNKLCIFVLGDLHKGKKIINTAEEISKMYEKLNFHTLSIIRIKCQLIKLFLLQ